MWRGKFNCPADHTYYQRTRESHGALPIDKKELGQTNIPTRRHALESNQFKHPYHIQPIQPCNIPNFGNYHHRESHHNGAVSNRDTGASRARGKDIPSRPNIQCEGDQIREAYCLSTRRSRRSSSENCWQCRYCH